MNTLREDECILYHDLLPTLGREATTTLVELVHKLAQRPDLQERNRARADTNPADLAGLYAEVARTSGERAATVLVRRLDPLGDAVDPSRPR